MDSTQSPWIACRHIHPSDDREVVVRNIANPDFLPEIVRWKNGEWVGRNQVVYKGITHWMPLPELFQSDA